ncbi:MAG TPA: BrnT family toxin [Gemmatirosa sp.]
MDLEFEWDPVKAAANVRAHEGVTFDEASTVFGDPLSSVFADPDHSLKEERLVVIGRSDRGRVLVVMFTERPPSVRLISARPATRPERAAYEAGDL